MTEGELYKKIRAYGWGHDSDEAEEVDVAWLIQVLEEAKKTSPLNFTVEDWNRFIRYSDEKWYIKVLQASFDWFRKQFGEAQP